MCERTPDMYSKKVLALLFIFALVCCSAVAQTSSSTQPPPPAANAVTPGAVSAPDDTLPVQTFHSRSDEVNIIFTVTDKHNKFIKDLNDNQFNFLDNNHH